MGSAGPLRLAAPDGGSSLEEEELPERAGGIGREANGVDRAGSAVPNAAGTGLSQVRLLLGEYPVTMDYHPDREASLEEIRVALHRSAAFANGRSEEMHVPDPSPERARGPSGVERKKGEKGVDILARWGIVFMAHESHDQMSCANEPR